MVVKVGQIHQIMVSMVTVTKMWKTNIKVMTEIKITTRIHQGVPNHQQEAFDHHHMVGQRIFHTIRIEKIAKLVIGQAHVTDHHTMKEKIKKVEAKVKTDHHTRIRDHQARRKTKDQDRIGEAAQAQVMKEGQLKL